MALPHVCKALPHLSFTAENKAMLTGPELGSAILQAINMKGVSKKAFADAMGVKPASVTDWVKFGRVAKTRINDLVAYFSDVVPVEYWGLNFGEALREMHQGPVTKGDRPAGIAGEIAVLAALAENEGVSEERLQEVRNVLQKLRSAQKANLAVDQSFAVLENEAQSPSDREIQDTLQDLGIGRDRESFNNERTGTNDGKRKGR